MRDITVLWTGQWRKARRAILERDRYICRIRGPGCTEFATCVDHITPRRDGGALFDPANLRAACKRCNGQREGGSRFRYQTPSPPLETRM